MTSQRKTHPLYKPMNSFMVDLPAPSNLSTWWNFGSLLGLFLAIQIITGLFLAMHYSPNTASAFSSIAHISRDVNYGWLLRSLHANGASMFFICIYLHIGRSVYYGSYHRQETWNIGVLILIMSMAAAFMGYVLVWGQMSFWGATVITNLLSAIPYMGHTIVEWVWGGFAVANATLNRFFVFHFIFPFIIAVFALMHLIMLHQTGSNNPLGLNSSTSKIPFHPYYSYKDMLGFGSTILILILISLIFPNLLSDPENFLPANPLSTPIHIKPEWYFLWAYAILRSIPNKLGGVAAMFAAILILFILPIIWKFKASSITFYPPCQLLFWSIVVNLTLLTWIGACPVEPPYIMLGQMFTMNFFLMFFMTPLTALLWDELTSSCPY